MLPHQLRGLGKSKKEEPGFGLPVYAFSLFLFKDYWAYQVALVVNNLSANAGDLRDVS